MQTLSFCCKMAQCLVYVIVVALCSSLPLCSAQGSGSGCGSPDTKLIAQQRLENLLGNIQAQLSPLLAPVFNDSDIAENITESPAPANESVIRMYEALINSTGSAAEQDYCRDGEFFAQPVSSFKVEMSINEEAESKRRRSANELYTRALLAEYAAQLNFHLNDSLQEISRADLLVYQLPTRTSPSVEPRDYRQYVEVSTKVDNQWYTVEGKYIDTFDDGFVVFQITEAVNMWIDHNINGLVDLKVAIYCYSSPDCAAVDQDGKRPAIVKFLTTSDQLDKTPRVIVNSYNSQEISGSSVFKRSTHESNEPTFCSSEEELCCLQPLTINFKNDLKLERVVYPPTFEANYCQGLCPSVGDSTVLTTQRYTFLSELGNNHPAASIEPCCAGEEYEHLDIVMEVYNTEVKRFEIQIVKLHQVKVVGCRCA